MIGTLIFLSIIASGLIEKRHQARNESLTKFSLQIMLVNFILIFPYFIYINYQSDVTIYLAFGGALILSSFVSLVYTLFVKYKGAKQSQEQ